ELDHVAVVGGLNARFAGASGGRAVAAHLRHVGALPVLAQVDGDHRTTLLLQSGGQTAGTFVDQAVLLVTVQQNDDRSFLGENLAIAGSSEIGDIDSPVVVGLQHARRGGGWTRRGRRRCRRGRAVSTHGGQSA